MFSQIGFINNKAERKLTKTECDYIIKKIRKFVELQGRTKVSLVMNIKFPYLLFKNKFSSNFNLLLFVLIPLQISP